MEYMILWLAFIGPTAQSVSHPEPQLHLVTNVSTTFGYWVMGVRATKPHSYTDAKGGGGYVGLWLCGYMAMQLSVLLLS